MKTEIKSAGLITDEFLKKWRSDEKERMLFNTLFPDGASLLDAMKELIKNNESRYAIWILRKKCLRFSNIVRLSFDEEFNVCIDCLRAFSYCSESDVVIDLDSVCHNEKCKKLTGILDLIEWVKNED